MIVFGEKDTNTGKIMKVTFLYKHPCNPFGGYLLMHAEGP